MSGRRIVIDASVLVKSVIDEELSDQSAEFLARGSQAGDKLVGPPLLLTEATNAVYQRFRRGDLADLEADLAVTKLLSLAIELVSPPQLISLGYSFARQHQLKNIYDCLYVVLARELGSELWTADWLLFKDMSAAAPWIRWIGDYQAP